MVGPKGFQTVLEIELALDKECVELGGIRSIEGVRSTDSRSLVESGGIRATCGLG